MDAVLIVGGSNDTGVLTTAEIYDPNTGVFTAIGSMAQPRELFPATRLINGQVLVAGGHCSCGVLLQVTATAEIFDPVTESFQSTGPLLGPRYAHTAALLPNG
jgi:hypothetical protein